MNNDLILRSFGKIKEWARRDGVGAEMMVHGGDRLKLGFNGGKMQTFESSSLTTAGLRLIDGDVQGYSSTENLAPEALERAYREALENARMLKGTGTGVAIPLAKPSPLTDEMTDLNRADDIEMDRKIAIARDLEQKTLAKDSRIHRVPYSGYSEGRGWFRLLNTEGLDRTHMTSSHSGYAYALAKDGESSKMDGASFFTRDFSQIALDAVIDEAVERAVSRLNAKQLKTGRLPVLLDREVAASFVGMLLDSLSAKTLFEKRSLLADKLGQKVISERLTLIDDPFDREGTGSRPFDDEGSPSMRTTLFENGVLKSYMTNLELAGRMGLPHTAHASRGPGSEMDVGATNLIVPKGTVPRGEMFKMAPRMLWLTEIAGSMHAGFKEASGDISLPCEGFLIENGEIVGAVDQFVLSGNVLTLLRDVIAVGDTYSKTPSSFRVPDLLVSELSVAGAKD